ncbi:hypothetical protein C8R47DRAFT_1127547 [Mycena vitilis]|nr:hypothetical protein C8R47DRAFT_1127547 [Mycena vitilis]
MASVPTLPAPLLALARLCMILFSSATLFPPLVPPTSVCTTTRTRTRRNSQLSFRIAPSCAIRACARDERSVSGVRERRRGLLYAHRRCPLRLLAAAAPFSRALVSFSRCGLATFAKGRERARCVRRPSPIPSFTHDGGDVLVTRARFCSRSDGACVRRTLYASPPSASFASVQRLSRDVHCGCVCVR